MEIRYANFYLNIPPSAEYITRAMREYHLGAAQISRFAHGEIYHATLKTLHF